MYTVVEEASGAVVQITQTLEEAKEYLEDKKPIHSLCKYLVFDQDDNVVYDTTPGISFKI